MISSQGDAPIDPETGGEGSPRDADPMLLRIVRFMTRLTRPLAGRRYFPLWAVIHHRGRRSGRVYAVPVGVRMTADAYFIALPFGDRTQWVRNVVAAGSCTLRWRGADIALIDPTIIRADEAAFAFPAVLRWMMRTAGARQVIRLRLAGER